MATKISIVDDGNRLRTGLGLVINGAEGLTCISQHANAEMALKEPPRNWPDVVLMDINLP